MPQDQQQDVQFTSKLPALIAAVVLALAALVATSRRALATALVLGMLAFAFLAYSLTIKDFCALKGTTMGQTAWGQGWGGGFSECVKAKGIWSF